MGHVMGPCTFWEPVRNRVKAETTRNMHFGAPYSVCKSLSCLWACPLRVVHRPTHGAQTNGRQRKAPLLHLLSAGLGPCASVSAHEAGQDAMHPHGNERRVRRQEPHDVEPVLRASRGATPESHARCTQRAVLSSTSLRRRGAVCALDLLFQARGAKCA